MSDGSVTTPRSRLGFTYYMPKQTDVQSCIDEVLSLHDPFSTSSEEGVTRCEANGTCKTTTLPVKAFAARRLLPSKAECSASSAVLFIRSAGLRDELGRNLDTVPDISEDDCLFSCLINKAADSEPISCVSAEYDAKKELCTLSSEARQNDLSVHPSSTIYEKICVAQSVAEQCSGAAVERIANTILIGYLRDSATTSGIEECIERCVRASTTLGFQCLSIMYFYDETILNCILNDASVRTNPEAISEEYSTTVDYFGVDDCYGLPEVSDSRQNFVRSYPILPATEKPSGDNPPRLHRLSSTVHRRTRR
ncbi:hypothetical protein Q1695_010309 [Nippostrongylus brasiliensis]|nr:hypothetical protein Q1695_010309 [Nippostrongylus brasiliensis]